MKNLFSEIYKWAVIFLVGILVGLVAAIKMIDKSSITNIQTGTYVAGLEQKIGKLKQRGEGNVQEIVLLPELSNRKLKRLARRAERRERRLNDETEKEESEQKNF
jgi:hypothetical protein